MAENMEQETKQNRDKTRLTDLKTKPNHECNYERQLQTRLIQTATRKKNRNKTQKKLNQHPKNPQTLTISHMLDNLMPHKSKDNVTGFKPQT